VALESTADEEIRAIKKKPNTLHHDSRKVALKVISGISQTPPSRVYSALIRGLWNSLLA
jgi:hypothetical protein